MTELIQVNNLVTHFKTESGLVKVDGVSYYIDEQEIIGIVGESGCGKTTVGRCILRLYKPTPGQIIFENEDISSYPNKKLRAIRSNISLIFQNPYSSLDPRQSAGSIVGEPLKIHQ